VVNVWQKQRKSQIQIMAKPSYCTMNGFGKMNIKNWSKIAMIRNTLKRIVEGAKSHKEL